MSYDTSLFDYDPGYYEFLPNNWLPGKIVSGSTSAWTQKAIDAAVNLDLKDTDVIIATYPKTGKFILLIIPQKMATFLSMEWPSTRLGDPTNRLITITVHKVILGGLGFKVCRGWQSSSG